MVQRNFEKPSKLAKHAPEKSDSQKSVYNTAFVGQKIGAGVSVADMRGRPCKGSRMGKMTFRVEVEKRERFVEYCRSIGSSACFELRNYVDARLGGESVVTSRYPLTIHLTQQYLFNNKRPRRIRNYPFEELESGWVVQHFGSREKCAYCGEKPSFLGFIWVSRRECNVSFLCDVHHAVSKERRQNYGFRRV